MPAKPPRPWFMLLSLGIVIFTGTVAVLDRPWNSWWVIFALWSFCFLASTSDYRRRKAAYRVHQTTPEPGDEPAP